MIVASLATTGVLNAVDAATMAQVGVFSNIALS